ncbi:hypothetical protein M569_15566 [Genlisea aurea]|uniref:S-protein homolog n=1 Tax=Genlisea aurea TaxID=192259 RepID=S8BXV8_9LAMI|nr:hypothetical protein M569_15566 [Genlisea aurea]
MKKLTVIIPLILFAIALSSSSRVFGSCFFTNDHVLVVTRNIDTDSDPVKVHCFSGNDDFGIHVLNGAEKFERKFCDNLLPNTQFFCRVRWREKQQGFVAYEQVMHYAETLNAWLVREDGIYLTHDWKVAVQKYDWA